MDIDRRRSRTVRVGILLFGLTLVPLTGAGWFAYGEIRSVDYTREQAATVRQAADELVRVTELQSAILDEGLYASITGGVESLGVDNQLVIDLLGIDLLGDLTEARARVDAMVSDLGSPAIEESMAVARRPSGLSAIMMSDQYEEVSDAVGQRTDQILQELLLVAGDSGEAGPLVAELQSLQYATIARETIVDLFLGEFAVQFSEPDHALAELREIIVSVGQYDEATNRLMNDSATSEPVRELLASIQASPAQELLRQSTDEVLADGLAGAIRPDPTMQTILLDVEAVAAQFHAGIEVTDRHLDLVIAAGDQVSAATAELGQAAADRTSRAALTISVLVLTTVAFGLAVGAFIGRPLRRLAESVGRLSAGDNSGKLRPTGPREIREATQALNEAVDNLAWAERQANALATGRLDDPDLDEAAPGAFGASLQEAVRTLTDSLAEREEFRRRLSHEASHDSLTQVANRRAVMTHLERSLARTHRSSTKLAVMFIDLDGFKAVNDMEGHPVGDAVLCAVARRLVTTVRQGDQVGRVGGDEFVVVAEPVNGVEEALTLAARIREAICAPISSPDLTVSVDASIGIAIVDADCSLNADELLRDADLAVYKAKGKGRGQIVVCDEELRSELEQRASLEHALRDAIAHDELVVHYQSIVDPQGSTVLALEALVRWDRPGTGLVPPDEFIPHAERSELIVDIDRWVLAAVARQMQQWTEHPVFATVPVAVNISARHLGRADFVAGILDTLRQYDVACDRLIVEVTESAVVDDLDTAGWALQELRMEGVRVAIDDFGTGYTSLAHLRALPIDILKIDRSFTSDPHAASLVQLIIDTGHLLGARITSEGIETEEQAAALCGMGSDELQGFLYGRPVPVLQLEAQQLTT